MKKADLKERLSWNNVIKGVVVGTAILFILFTGWLRFVAGLSLSDLTI